MYTLVHAACQRRALLLLLLLLPGRSVKVSTFNLLEAQSQSGQKTVQTFKCREV